MAKKHLRTLALLLTAFALGSMFLIACARPGSPTASTGGSSSSGGASSSSSCDSGTTVKTGLSSFESTCITFAKGSTLQIVQDQTSYHVFDYGKWDGTTAAPAQAPAGAPAIKDLTLSGASVNIGPFTTAGTFYIYCTVHQGMTLQVIVK